MVMSIGAPQQHHIFNELVENTQACMEQVWKRGGKMPL
jgi:hypothetical protein